MERRYGNVGWVCMCVLMCVQAYVHVSARGPPQGSFPSSTLFVETGAITWLKLVCLDWTASDPWDSPASASSRLVTPRKYLSLEQWTSLGHSGVGRSSSLSGAPQPCSLFCHTEEAHLQKGLQMSMKIQSFQQGKARFYNHAEKLNLRQESLFCFVLFLRVSALQQLKELWELPGSA